VRALVLAYLALWPIAAAPVAWVPRAAPALSGPYARNDALAEVQRIDVGGRGPEDVAFGPDGALYAGLEDGRIVRLRPGGEPETFAHTGGRPLGLAFAPDGRLMVADAARGLLAVDPAGVVAVLSAAEGGRPFGLADDLDVAADGTVYFTDATHRHPVGRSIEAIVEHRADGRLLAYRDGATRLVRGNLDFANGVALAADGSFLLVAETASYRITRCWLHGPHAGFCDVFADNLPGFPDGVTRGDDGLFWVAIAAPRNALLDRLHPHPALKKALLRLPGWIRPKPRRYAFVLAYDADGRLVRNLQDPSGRAFRYVTNAVQHEDALYLGSLELPAVGKLVMKAVSAAPAASPAAGR
jgi:sugar lactone lactonase YvrE